MQRRTTWERARAMVAAVVVGGIPLVTVASCDPRTGTFDFFRDDDYGDYDSWDYGYDGYWDYGYVECWDDCGYGYDEFFLWDW